MVMGGRITAAVSWLVLVPGLACADFSAASLGRAPAASSMLIQPSVGFLSQEPSPVMFQGPFDASRLGVSMGYADKVDAPAPYQASGIGVGALPEERLFSATAIGEYAISERVGVFGKFGIRYLSGEVPLGATLIENIGHAPQLNHRYGVGVKLAASEVLSLHFEWERYAQGSEAAGTAASPGSPAWDPWKERNVFGAGVHLGF